MRVTSLSVFPILSKDDQKDSPTELAFKYAVYRINKADDVLPNNTLVYDIQYVPAEDSFRTTRKVSRQSLQGICVHVGPTFSYFSYFKLPQGHG